MYENPDSHHTVKDEAKQTLIKIINKHPSLCGMMKDITS
jgi:hypothetical protein